MSSTLSNIQLASSVSTLDGLSVINADQLFENNIPIIASSYVPYNNAVQAVNLNNQNLTNVNNFSSSNINFSGLINSIPALNFQYLSGANSNVQTQINTINTTLTNVPRLNSSNIYTSNNYFNGANTSVGGNLYVVQNLYLSGPISSTSSYNLDFYSDTDPIRFYSQGVLYLTINSSGLTFTTAINGISPTVFNYLSGASSNIQTQINNIVSSLSNYVPYSGATSTVDLGSQRILSSATPNVGQSLINLTYANANYPTFSYLNSNFLTIASASSTYQTLNSPVNAVGSTFDTSVGGNNVIVISRSTGSNFYNDGPMIQFRQTYFPNNSIIATGGISGYQYTSGSFGGGLSFFYTPLSQSTLVRGMSISKDGYVMIGSSTNPAYKLDVDGYINTNQGLVLSGATTLTNTVLGYISTLSSNAQTQITNNTNSINTINTTLTNVPLLNASNLFSGSANIFGGVLNNNQSCQLSICNNQSSGWIASSHTSTYASSTPDRVVIGWLSGYGATVGCHNYNLSAWGTINIIGGNSAGTISRIYINDVGVYFERALNGISPTVFNYLSGASSNLQTQITNNTNSINTINTTISGLPTLSGSNTFTGSNNFTNTAFYFAQINGNNIASNAGDLGLYASGSTNIRFYVNGSNLFTINSSGLNNISPTVFGYLSGVNSNIQTQFNTINSTISGLPTLSANNIFTGSNRFPNINIGTGTAQQNNLVKIDNGNWCGVSLGDYNINSLRYIGITNPSDGTDIGENTGFSGILFGAPTVGSSGGAGGNLMFYTHNYGVSSGKRMVISASGNVGINNQVPSYLLDVNGEARIASNCIINGQLNCNTLSSTASNNLSIYSSSTLMNFFVNGSNHHTCSFGTGSSSLFNCPTSIQIQLNGQNCYYAISNSHTWYLNNIATLSLINSSGDWLSWSRLTNNPAIAMGNNYIAYATSGGQWVTGSSTADMVLRTATNIRFTVDQGSTEVMSCQSNNVVITGNVKGTSAINLMLGSGSNSCGKATALNNTNTVYTTSIFSGGDWTYGNYHVLTNSSSCTGTTAGLGMWGGSTCGLVALAPQVQWLGMYISGGAIYTYIQNTLGAYLSTGGWVNVSDERCKRDIKPLKTTRSLERVLNVKTYTYKRICKPTEHGGLDEKISEKPLVGFIAQEVQSSNPHCLDTWIDRDEKDEERFGINYNDYVVHLVGAVQEQNKTIQEQDKVIQSLSAQSVEQATTIKTLQTDIATLYQSLTQVINTLNSLNKISS